MEACRLVHAVLGAFFGGAHGTQIILRHEPGVLRAGVAGEVVEVRVSTRRVSSAEQLEYGVASPVGLHVFRPDGIEPLEHFVALVDPVVVLVGRDLSPVVDASDGPRVAQDRQLLLALEVIADVTV